MPAQPPVTTLADNFLQRLHKAQAAHYAQCEKLHRYYLWLNMATIACSTTVSAFLFFDYSKAILWVRVIILGLSILAPLLAAFQSQLGLAEKAERHRVAAAEYGKLRRRLETFAMNPGNTQEMQNFMDQLREDWDKVAVASPVTPLSSHHGMTGANT